MAHVVLNLGHCFRTKGATGTHREQEFVSKLAPKIRDLVHLGGHHAVTLTLADQRPLPSCDLFIALHCDGSTNRSARGLSVGYPSSTAARSAAYARRWQAAMVHVGYTGGVRPDNYTAALRNHYTYGRVNAPVKILCENGFTTNPQDEQWLFENIDKVAIAHAFAIESWFGTFALPQQEDDKPRRVPFRFDPWNPPLLRRSLVHTSTGQVVKHLQEFFGIPQTGIYDPLTGDAVLAFQAWMGLEPTGVVDHVTWVKIIECNNLRPA